MKIKDRAKPALPPVPAGQYLAVCVGVYDLGEQYSEKYKNYSPKLMISFDIPSVTIEVEGKMEPRQLSREFTISGKNNSKLRAFISSWNGVQYSDEAFGEFDPLTQVGKPAMINVLLNETGEYANIDTIMPMFPGLPAPATTTPFRVWDMDKWDDKAFEDLPAWVQEKIKKSSQYQKSVQYCRGWKKAVQTGSWQYSEAGGCGGGRRRTVSDRFPAGRGCHPPGKEQL